MRSKKSGFSMIEVALVLTLMAILVTFALPQFSDWVGKSEESVEVFIISSMEEGLNNLYAEKFANNIANQGSDYPPNPFDALDAKPNYVPFEQFDWHTKNKWSYQLSSPGPANGSGYILHTRNNGDTYYITYSFNNSTTPGLASTYQISNPNGAGKQLQQWTSQ